MNHSLIAALLLFSALLAPLAEAARTTPPVRPAAYRNLDLAQQYSDAKKWQQALDELSTLKRGEARLNGYEKAMMYNLYGFVYFSQSKFDQSISSYEQVISDVSMIPEPLEHSTLYGLAQLYFGNEQYKKSISFMNRWIEATGKNNLQAQLLIAQGYYQLKQYKQGIAPMLSAIEFAKADGQAIPDENWLLLLRVFYFESNQKKQATKVMESLVNWYPTKNYWQQLATIYGQRNLDLKQLDTFDVMYRQGMLDQEAELINYSQLLLSSEVPYQAAKVISKGLKNKIIEDNLENRQLLARAHSQAKDYDQAITAFKYADKLDNSGESLYSAARLLVLQQDWTALDKVLTQAQSKGQLDRADQAWMMLGMAQFNLKKFDLARVSFNKALKDKRSLKAANQWISYVNSEQKRYEQLKAFM